VQQRHLVAEQVRAARTRKQWTRGRLAEEVQATHAEITAIELSAADIPPDLLGRIATVLGARIDGVTIAVRSGRSPAPTPPTHPTEREECIEMSDTPRSDQIDARMMTEADSAPPTPTDLSELAGTEGSDAERKSAGATVRAGRPRAGAKAAAADSRDQETLSLTATSALDDRERHVVALLERVAGGRFVYQDGHAWLLHDADAIVAESRLLAAYALLTDALLSAEASVGDDERAQVRRLHRSLFAAPAAQEATRRGGRR